MLVREPCGGNRSRHTRHDTKTHGMHVSGPIDMLTESQKQHLNCCGAVGKAITWEARMPHQSAGVSLGHSASNPAPC